MGYRLKKRSLRILGVNGLMEEFRNPVGERLCVICSLVSSWGEGYDYTDSTTVFFSWAFISVFQTNFSHDSQLLFIILHS